MRSRFGGSIAALVAGLALMLPAVASAQSDYSWTGGGSSADWSDAGNWGGAAPTGDSSLGTVTFGPLSNCAMSAPCHEPSNDVAGLTVDALSFWPDYFLSGDSISLGAGGITSTAGSGESEPTITMPLVLSGPQTWTMESALDVDASVTGNEPLTAEIGSGSELRFDLDAEVGPFTAGGSGLLTVPAGGSLNASDDEPISASGVTVEGGGGGGIQDGDPASTGPIALHAAKLQIGTGYVPDSSLNVSGGVSFDAGSTYETYVDDPITDTPQLDATGNVTLGGTLSPTEGFETTSGSGPSTCAPVTQGTTATLISDPTGTISGTFANAPNGSVIPLGPCFSSNGAGSAVQISYTAHTVTATIAATTTTGLSADPSRPLTNQRVTLTAQVRTDGGAPNGTVGFADDGSPIPDCTAKPVIAGAATCTTTFAAAASPAQLTATFSQNRGADQESSTSPTVSVTTSGATATATISCRGGTGQRCALAIALTAGSKGKTTKVGSARASLAASPANPRILPTVRIKLTAAGRRLLSAHRRLRVTLTAVQTILGKPKKLATRTIMFRTA